MLHRLWLFLFLPVFPLRLHFVLFDSPADKQIKITDGAFTTVHNIFVFRIWNTPPPPHYFCVSSTLSTRYLVGFFNLSLRVSVQFLFMNGHISSTYYFLFCLPGGHIFWNSPKLFFTFIVLYTRST